MVAEHKSMKPKPLEKSAFFELYPYVVSAPLPLRSTTGFISKTVLEHFRLKEGAEINFVSFI